MFYKLKLKATAKGTSKEVFGVSVNKEVSTYVETVRDLVAEADKKKLTTVEISPLAQLPERGEDGNAPRLVDFKDEGLAQEAADEESAE